MSFPIFVVPWNPLYSFFFFQEILESEKFQLGRVFWKANTWYKNGFDNLEKQLVEFTRKESSEPNCRIYVIEERSKKLQIKVTFNSMEIQRLL